MSKQEQMQKAYEEYCERMASSRGMTVEDVKKLKIVQNYKEYLELGFNERMVE